MIFNREDLFERALIDSLKNKGWEDKVLKYPTEEDLIENWASILFENNRGIDRLNDVPLSKNEMQQILDQVNNLRTPLKLNGFINGKTIIIKRDNPKDKLHLGKEVSLKIYDRLEITAGQSRYQIAQQPRFKANNPILNNRRGDFMLLINGMPVIHVELKKSGVPISQAYNQIEKYSKEKLFTGIYSLLQIFVAMNPEECVYFANPGPDGKFNKDFYFNWADYNNEPVNDWKQIANSLLSIPMAHQLIGFYTVADDSDGVLKVMRSYQYHAANKISDVVSKLNWKDNKMLGGYIWHTTGSGKTMTSFKSAQIISKSNDADKVVFLVDRIELGTQSLSEYRAFSDDSDQVQATENTKILVSKLKSDNPADTLIVTSIQKMSRIESDEDGLNKADINKMNSKKIVFIVDEAHRSTFGDMLITIKETFPGAIYFGFTGTPIYDKNKKKKSTTSMVFGDELHRYTIADGIRDGNVLGFYPYKVNTFKDSDIRKQIAIQKAGASNEKEAFENPDKKKVYMKYMNQIEMSGKYDGSGQWIKGIEDYVPVELYNSDEHREKVVEDINEKWITLSQNGKFHAIFATSSIVEAIKYYKLIKKKNKDLRVTALFDPNIDNNGNECGEGNIFKEEGLVEILTDYNNVYEKDFNLATHKLFKKDVAARLAHKKPYKRIENDRSKQLDILIVVDQMLTGFDSKWVNTLYLDKVIKYENIIQAFSRTNRLFGHDKPFGVIRYYRYPNTMEIYIEEAIKYYSGNRKVDLFVQHLPYNLKKMNELYKDIVHLFELAGIENFKELPKDDAMKGEFSLKFIRLNEFLEAARIQGFKWNREIYKFEDHHDITVLIDETTYLILVQRYKELEKTKIDDERDGNFIEIEGYITEVDTGKIDNDYMNSRFEKYLRDLDQNVSAEELQTTLNDIYKSFAGLTQEQQKFAKIFLHDVERGDAKLVSGKKFREYITEYQLDDRQRQINELHEATGVDTTYLKELMEVYIDGKDINEFGRFDKLMNTVDIEKAKKYDNNKNGKERGIFLVKREIYNLLKEFVEKDGIDIYPRVNSSDPYDINKEEINIFDANILVAEEKEEY